MHCDVYWASLLFSMQISKQNTTSHTWCLSHSSSETPAGTLVSFLPFFISLTIPLSMFTGTMLTELVMTFLGMTFVYASTGGWKRYLPVLRLPFSKRTCYPTYHSKARAQYIALLLFSVVHSSYFIMMGSRSGFPVSFMAYFAGSLSRAFLTCIWSPVLVDYHCPILLILYSVPVCIPEQHIQRRPNLMAFIVTLIWPPILLELSDSASQLGVRHPPTLLRTIYSKPQWNSSCRKYNITSSLPGSNGFWCPMAKLLFWLYGHIRYQSCNRWVLLPTHPSRDGYRESPSMGTRYHNQKPCTLWGEQRIDADNYSSR